MFLELEYLTFTSRSTFFSNRIVSEIIRLFGNFLNPYPALVFSASLTNALFIVYASMVTIWMHIFSYFLQYGYMEMLEWSAIEILILLGKMLFC